VRSAFLRFEQQAIDSLDAVDQRDGGDTDLRRHQADLLSRVISTEALEELATAGILPMTTVHEAAERITSEISGRVS
jgi:hypothetical protein